MSADQTEAFVERFRRAWEAREPAQFAALMHPDAVVRQPPVRDAFAGHQIDEYFTQILGALPDLTLKPLEWAARGDIVMIEWEITATVGDGPLSWRGVDRFHLRDGLADDEAVYFDSLRVWERLDPDMQRPDIVVLT